MNKSFLGGAAAVTIVVLLIICCCISMCFLSFTSLLGSSADVSTGSLNQRSVYGRETSGNKFLAINISGPIYTERSGGESFNLLGSAGGVYGYDLKKQLVEAADDDSIDGIILEINSPGGTIAGANAISDGVEYYREQTGKPIVAHITDTGASGAYWAAISADHVMADMGTSLGSIGVIFGPFVYYDGVIEEGSILGNVVTQNGIETTYITAGEYKDLGNPYRRVTSEERSVLQASVNNEYENFVNFVSDRRDIPSSEIKSEIGALIYGTKQALDLGLIDAQGSREDAYAALAERAGVGEDYQVVRRETVPGFFESFLSAGSGVEQNQAATTKCRLCTQMLYLYGNPLQY